MTRAILILTLVLGLVGMARAQSEMARDPAIESVIQGQIDAFLVDDFAAAFDYASPGIKAIFGSVDRFAAMVKQGYPMIHRPSDIQFLELRDVAGALKQKILVRDAARVYHALEYEMVQTENGWQINGVQLLQAPQVGA